MCHSETAGGILTIDLGALVRNYRILCDSFTGETCAAVVKANAYGLGMATIAPALARAGCGIFFVATLDEGGALRALLADVTIAVFNGPAAGQGGLFADARLTPVLNEPGQIETWQATCRSRDDTRAAILHVDTGMNRLGLSMTEVRQLAEEPERLEGVAPAAVMSHLACAEDPDHELNAEQLARFRAARALLESLCGPLPASLANSSGLFLGPAYHFDLARPGVALYGVNPTPAKPNPMRQVVQLQGKIVQLREIDRDGTVGYGATRRVARGARIATVSAGYADGYLRSLSDQAVGYIGSTRIPQVGRISMDLLTFDVSALPPEDARPGTCVTLIGPDHPVDSLATEAGTTGYEILTALGARYERHYRGGGD